MTNDLPTFITLTNQVSPGTYLQADQERKKYEANQSRDGDGSRWNGGPGIVQWLRAAAGLDDQCGC
jgi:hypothetical protein